MALELTKFDQSVTRQQAHEFQAVMYQDYLRIGIEEDAASDMAFEGGNANPGNLMRRMTEGPKEYYGLSSEGTLVASAVLGDWLYGDQAPYSYPFMTAVRRARHRAQVRRGTEPVHDTGLHAFAVNGDDRYDQIAGRMLHDMTEVAHRRGSAMLKASIDDDDQALMATFESVGGKPLSRRLGRLTIHGVERDYRLWGIDVS